MTSLRSSQYPPGCCKENWGGTRAGMKAGGGWEQATKVISAQVQVGSDRAWPGWGSQGAEKP